MVTSNGLIYTVTPANQYGNQGGPPGNQLECADFNVLVLGGPTASLDTMQLICVWLLQGYGSSLSDYAAANGYTLASGEPYSTVQNAAGINYDAGYIMNQDGMSLKIPGVTGTTGYLDLFLWEGNYSTLQDAVYGGRFGTTGVFAQTVPQSVTPGDSLNNMPDVLIGWVPEPGTSVLVGLGCLSILLFRCRKPV